MEAIDKYLKLEDEINKYFGYVENWVTIPMDDRREYLWTLVGESDETAESVRFADTIEELEGEDENYYEDEIYTQRFLPKYVYRGEDFTMVCVDTHTNGNKYLAIYDNKKEIK